MPENMIQLQKCLGLGEFIEKYNFDATGPQGILSFVCWIRLS